MSLFASILTNHDIHWCYRDWCLDSDIPTLAPKCACFDTVDSKLDCDRGCALQDGKAFGRNCHFRDRDHTDTSESVAGYEKTQYRSELNCNSSTVRRLLTY